MRTLSPALVPAAGPRTHSGCSALLAIGAERIPAVFIFKVCSIASSPFDVLVGM
jgi:hypothetical protein